MCIYIYICIYTNIHTVTGCNLLQCVCATLIGCQWSPFIHKGNPCISSPRLAVHLILCAEEDAFTSLWACVCSSWVAINQFTSKRCKLLPEGNMDRDYIKKANSMVSRYLSLISIVIWHMHAHTCTHVWFCESPSICMYIATLIDTYMCIYTVLHFTWILLRSPLYIYIYKHPDSLGVFSS